DMRAGLPALHTLTTPLHKAAPASRRHSGARTSSPRKRRRRDIRRGGISHGASRGCGIRHGIEHRRGERSRGHWRRVFVSRLRLDSRLTMPKYLWKARDETGKLLSGKLEAASKGDVLTQLKSMHLKVISVQTGSEATIGRYRSRVVPFVFALVLLG